jgi:hypothetical protein
MRFIGIRAPWRGQEARERWRFSTPDESLLANLVSTSRLFERHNEKNCCSEGVRTRPQADLSLAAVREAVRARWNSGWCVTCTTRVAPARVAAVRVAPVRVAPVRVAPTR